MPDKDLWKTHHLRQNRTPPPPVRTSNRSPGRQLQLRAGTDEEAVPRGAEGRHMAPAEALPTRTGQPAKPVSFCLPCQHCAGGPDKGHPACHWQEKEFESQNS